MVWIDVLCAAGRVSLIFTSFGCSELANYEAVVEHGVNVVFKLIFY